MKKRIQEFLHATPFRPFNICMADGKVHRIDHPEFVLASSDAPQVIIEAQNGNVTYLSVLLMTAVEHAPARKSRKTHKP